MTDKLKFNPNFDFEKSNITESNIKDEVAALLNQANEIQDELNPFPYEVFPEAIQQIIINTNQNLNFPLDFIGASMLFAASVAIGNTHRVEVKKGWTESPVLYLAIVARAGTNKSHPLSFAINPIAEQDKKTFSMYEQQKLEYENALYQSKNKNDQQDSDKPIKPVWQKFLLSDYTPEALAMVHKFNRRGIGVYNDELAGWFKNFNRYNKGSEMEFWISVWSGKPINIDRKTGDPIFIPLPFISVAGTIQNGLLYELAKDNRTHNGFIDRILFVIPDNLQKEYWNDAEISQDIISNWQAIIGNLINLSVDVDTTSNPIPVTLHFTPDAKHHLFQWQKYNADQCNIAENETISGIYSKLEMYAVRLSLILQMMKFACQESDKNEITLDAVIGAIKLVEYFKKSSVKVYSIISDVNPLDKLTIDKQNLYHELPVSFSIEEGFHIASKYNINQRTFHRLLINKELFAKLSRGNYEKLI